MSSNYDLDSSPASAGHLRGPRIGRAASVLICIVAFASGLHFWPLEQRRMWQLAGPVNSALAVWWLLLAFDAATRRRWAPIRARLPHVSVIAYVAISALSIAVAPDRSRAVVYVGKLSVVCFGAYTLVLAATTSWRGATRVYGVLTASAFVCVGYCIVMRWGPGRSDWGFFANPLKYGTYIGMLVPLCATWLLCGRRRVGRLLGGGLVVAGLVTVGSLGGGLAIVVGMLSAAAGAGGTRRRSAILAVVVAAVVALPVLWARAPMAPLRDDVALREPDAKDVRQRYIEWQAFINMVEARPVTGVGAGCINEYRSAFYFRLPKRNTIAPFDQNGYLAVAAETGVFGLAALLWALAHFVGIAWRHGRAGAAHGVANLAGLAGACVANAFCSVQYNGLFVVFVIILALTTSTAGQPEQTDVQETL